MNEEDIQLEELDEHIEPGESTEPVAEPAAPVAEPKPDAAMEAISRLTEQVSLLTQTVEQSRQKPEPVDDETFYSVLDKPISEVTGDIAQQAAEVASRVASAKSEMLREFDEKTKDVPEDIRNKQRAVIVNASARDAMIGFEQKQHLALAKMAVGEAVMSGFTPGSNTRVNNSAEPAAAARGREPQIDDNDKELIAVMKAAGLSVDEKAYRSAYGKGN